MKKGLANFALLTAGCVCAILVGEIIFRLWFGIGLFNMPYFYNLDENEFRNRPGAPWTAPGEALRIAVLGDSYSYGYGVRENMTYPRLLESHGKTFSPLPVRVANFSKMGLNTETEVDIFLNRPDRDVFDVVILGYTFNDIEREPILVSNPRALALSFQFTMLHSLLMASYQARQFLNHGMKDYSRTLEEFYENKDSEEWTRMTRAILKLDTYCKSRGKKLVILLFEIYCDKNTRSLRTIVHDEMLKFAQNENIAFVGIPPLGNCDAKKYQVHAFDTHPNALGHELAFDALRRYFLDKGTLQ